MAEFSRGNSRATIVNASGVAVCFVSENFDIEWLLNRAAEPVTPMWPLRVELEKPGMYAMFEDAGELADQLDGDQSTIDKLKERCKAYEQANANLDRELNATIDKLWRKHRKAKRRLAAEKALTAALLKARGVK